MWYKKLRRAFKRWLYGSCPGVAGAFLYFGTRVYFPVGSHIFNLACKQGIYEMQNVFLLQSLIQPNSVYFDVGANIGLMAVPFLVHCQTCRVISFEPSSNSLGYLKRTVAGSEFGDRWQVIGKAVGSAEGELDFCIAPAAEGAFDGFRATSRVSAPETIRVAVTTLDREWEALGKPRVSVIKLDVEGAELAALAGAIACIQAEQPCILVEWNAANLPAYDCPPERLLAFADQIGYQVVAVPSLLPVSNPTLLHLHMQQTENFLLMPAGRA